MHSAHCIPSRTGRFLRAHAVAAAWLALPLLAGPAAAQEEATPAQRLTGQAARAIRPAEPASLRLGTPGGLWASGEAALDQETPDAEASLRDASITLGLKRELALSPTLSSSLVPQLRLEAAPAPTPGAAPVLGATLRQDVAISLPGATRLSATVAVAERIAGAGSATGGLTMRGHAAIATQASFAGTPVRAELQVSASRAVADSLPELRATCQLALAVSWGSTAPIRLAGSCPGEAAPRVTIGISAAF